MDNEVKIKASEKRNKYLEKQVRRKLRKLLDITMTVIPKVIGGLGSFPKRWEKGFERIGNQWTNPDHPDDN